MLFLFQNCLLKLKRKTREEAMTCENWEIKRREAHFRSLNFLAPVVAYCSAIFEGRELSDPKAGRPSSAERSKSTCKKCQRVCMSLVQSWYYIDAPANLFVFTGFMTYLERWNCGQWRQNSTLQAWYSEKQTRHEGLTNVRYNLTKPENRS